MLTLVFPEPRFPLGSPGNRIVGVWKVRDNMSPGDSPDVCEYCAAGIVRRIGWSERRSYSRIIRMLDQELDQSLKRPIIPNKIDSGRVPFAAARVGSDALVGPLPLDCRVGAFFPEFCERRARRSIQARRSTLVFLGRARQLQKDRNGKIPGNRRLHENYVVSIFLFHRLEGSRRRATG